MTAPTTTPGHPLRENGTPGTQRAGDLASLNAEVEALAARHRWRTERLADGEVVIRLPGKAGAHSGRWGRLVSYLLIPCSMPARRAAILLRQFPVLKDRSSDAEVLMLGANAVVEAMLASGPGFARARRKRSADHGSHLAPFRATPLRGRPGRHLAERESV